MRLSPLLVLLLPALLPAQPGPANLRFVEGATGEVPPGWFAPVPGYRVEVRREGCRNAGPSRSGCVVIFPAGGGTLGPFGNLMQSFNAVPLRGKSVRYRAVVRVEGSSTSDRGQMWIRVDRSNREMGFFDNMGDRPITSAEWKTYEIAGEIDADALVINIGVMSFGKARVWIDQIEFDVIPETVVSRELTAAREEMRKIYARLDAAYTFGRIEELRALALPDAQIVAGANRVPLSVTIDEIAAALKKGATYTSRSTVTSVRLSGDDAIISVLSEGSQTSSGVKREIVVTNRDTWTKTRDGWRLKESVFISGKSPTMVTDAQTAKPVVAELKQRAHALTTAVAGNPATDLAAFGRAVGDARIVALGEASHGTREFFQMKHRLLEYLVKEKGFTVFAIEANWPEALEVDRYIKTGEGDPKAALAGMYFWTWNTEEVLAMIEWMRAYNQRPGKHPLLTFTSFDMQTARVAAQKAADYLKQYSPSDMPPAEALFVEVRSLEGQSSSGMYSNDAKTAADHATALVKVFDDKRAALAKASSLDAWRDARQAAAIVLQACTMRVSGNRGGYRDEMMAANVEWLASQVHPGEKIVLWAHNGHVRFGSEGTGMKSMGTWLRERYGRKMYVAGFAFRRGELRAIGRDADGKMQRLANHAVPSSGEGTGDAILSGAGMPIFFLDMSTLPRDGPLARWLAEPHLFHNVGAIWFMADPGSNLFPGTLSKEYDGLIFFEEGHAAVGLTR